MVSPGDAIRDHLLAAKKIPAETRRRLLPHEFETISKGTIEGYEQSGWVVDRELKTRAKMRREKRHGRAFEDRVWAMCARLQFTHLNRGPLKLKYGQGVNQTRQIDVFAADEEVILVVECRSTQTIQAGQFKKETEAICGQRAGIMRQLRAEYGTTHKVKFVFATNNYTLSDAVQQRLAEAQIFHINEDTVDYYLSLADHLGAAAKYQLLGALFAGTKIPNLEPTVPAIRGSMGGHTFYSFAIEPARLLKMSFVLHRNQANSSLMPTYQRLIKKSRLKKVSEFVEQGGFFPNSIILNIETTKRRGDLQFDLAGKSPSEAKIGFLHLPQIYRAAYVIDGQHRLYGYANCARGETDLVPVVAFVDLPQAEQVKLFMQINENQQAVPKNLRNTLNADLLWTSDDYTERARALRLKIAQDLGDQKTSPLYGRVIVGENQRTNIRCITIDAISNGLMRGNFIGTFTKTGAKNHGTFYAGDNKATAKRLIPFLEGAFGYMRDELPIQWALGGAEGGFVLMNNGVEASIRLLSDIVDHVKEHDAINPLTATPDELLDACRYLLDPLVEHLDRLSPEEGLAYRKLYGTGGVARYYRLLQQAVRDARPEFDPPELAEWLKAQDKEFITEATTIVRDLEECLKDDIRTRLQDQYGSDWQRSGIPRKLLVDRGKDAVEKNIDLPADKQVDLWDCMYLIDYESVLLQNHRLWQERFEKRYTKPGDEQKTGGWKARASWLGQLNKIRNNVSHAQGVSEEDYAFLTELRDWLLLDKVDNEL
ncbi:MAG: DGQHR domain-containing protein [Solirubrobacteraceae bacterium]